MGYVVSWCRLLQPVGGGQKIFSGFKRALQPRKLGPLTVSPLQCAGAAFVLVLAVSHYFTPEAAAGEVAPPLPARIAASANSFSFVQGAEAEPPALPVSLQVPTATDHPRVAGYGDMMTAPLTPDKIAQAHRAEPVTFAHDEDGDVVRIIWGK